ncbi:MAG: tRNA uridine-5-carboxymethylaminomethyl(34) synthesis GTPase MnmE [Fimbriimonadaceae bacterium]|nr:tRNA uridine-5-carboxymethylaminomethyl(34) synthesis GTPase MnmE [Fimbriimonadaceae bacterium]
MPFFDTIVAPITGTEPAAVAIVRVSGPDAFEVARCAFAAFPSHPEPNRFHYGTFANGDDGIVLAFDAGHGYTGERAVEFCLHGSRASVRTLLARCLEAGARLARPGEFSQRAFLNGRLDLTQAEGVQDTVNAATDVQLRLANAVRSGVLGKEVAALRESVAHLMATVEASVDFSEEVGEVDRETLGVDLRNVSARIDRLLATAGVGRIVRAGLRIAIVGRPNAGKSSLLNTLLDADRAIVTDIPGTTRDYVEERVDLGGVPCTLVDTAGLRATHDPIEYQGVERAKAIADDADLVWYLYDASVGLTDEDRTLAESFVRPVWLVANKVDLGLRDAAETPHAVSSVTRNGIADLVSAVAGFVAVPADERWVAVNARHAKCLDEAKNALAEATRTLAKPVPDDMVTVSLQRAYAALGEITGETASPDLIERVFRDFCVGK